MRKYKRLLIASCIGLGLALPVLLTLLMKIIAGGGVGPFVLLVPVMNALVFPVLLFFLFQDALSMKFWKPLLAFLSIPVGILLAVLCMNWFILITHLFGMMDYGLM